MYFGHSDQDIGWAVYFGHSPQEWVGNGMVYLIKSLAPSVPMSYTSSSFTSTTLNHTHTHTHTHTHMYTDWRVTATVLVILLVQFASLVRSHFSKIVGLTTAFELFPDNASLWWHKESFFLCVCVCMCVCWGGGGGVHAVQALIFVNFPHIDLP